MKAFLTATLTACFLCTAGIVHGQLAQSTFDSVTDGSNGWSVVDRTFDSLEVIGTRAPVYQSTGGNPGGFINVLDGTGDFYFRAPSTFLGDKSAAYGYSLQFDLISDVADVPTTLKYSVILIGGGITNYASFLAAPPANTWTHFSVPVQAGAPWTNAATGLPATQANLTSCLAALQSLDIAGEFGTGIDTGGIDNVTMFGSGFNYNASFNTGIFDPNFILQGTTNWVWIPGGNGVGGVGTNGTLELYNTLPAHAGAAYISKFLLTGDFEVSVNFDRSSLWSCAAGIMVYFAPNGSTTWVDCYCNEMGKISCSGLAPSASYSTGASTGILRIRRIGTTLFADCNVGNGYVGIRTNTAPDLDAPVQVGLVLIQDGSDGPNQNHIFFDNLSVHADGLLSPCPEMQRGTDTATVKWPSAVGSVIETTPVLGPLSVWTPLTNTPIVNAWHKTVTLSHTNSAQFFRINAPKSYF